jgi:hypothetical protein
MRTISRCLGARGKTLKVNFDVEGKRFQAYVPDDALWGPVKDILLNREYEYAPEFELRAYPKSRAAW